MDLLDQNPLSGFVLNINQDFLWKTFTVVLILYVLFTIVLFYHWQRYGMKSFLVVIAEIIYFVVTLGLLFIATLAISSF